MFHSFKQFPRYVTGACCLFLAGKVEETPKKCKDIIKTARSLLNDVQFAQFGDDPKEEVMVLERILLQTIKFDLQVEHPYQFLLRYAKQLKDRKPPPVVSAPVGEADLAVTGDSIEIPKGPVPPPPHQAPVHQPPPLPHRPPPPPPSSYIMGMSTSSSYMSGEGYQSLQSMMKTEGPSYGAMPPSYGPPMPYHPHVYPPNPPPPVPPPSANYPPPNLPPPSPAYPPPGYNHNYPPPPRLPPGHGVPPPGLGIPPANYPPHPGPPGGQPQVPPLPPPGMPQVGGMSRGGWMR
ncbi:UNVERIFIED_CONTAM: hypothetical protein FKN15_009724 [Acipenser sinensis]